MPICVSRDRRKCRVCSPKGGHFSGLPASLKHGSWLDMAEIELSILSRQVLSKPNAVSFSHAVRSWTSVRNAGCKKIHWQFTTPDVRIKLGEITESSLTKWKEFYGCAAIYETVGRGAFAQRRVLIA